MKKLLTLITIAMVASTASAVSFKWTSDAMKFGSTSVGANATGYLVFLGNNTLGSEGYEWADIIEMDTDGSAATKMGKMNVPSVDTGSHGIGNYVMYATFTSDGKTYYNVSSTTYTISQSAYNALMNEGTALPPATFSGLASVVNPADATPGIGDGWFLKPTTPDPGPTPGVPEPATGALALAGVALLFKRRRA